jgi:hypothetical protein
MFSSVCKAMFGHLFLQALVGALPAVKFERRMKSVAGISWQVLGLDFKEARDDSRGLIQCGLRLQLLRPVAVRR